MLLFLSEGWQREMSKLCIFVHFELITIRMSTFCLRGFCWAHHLGGVAPGMVWETLRTNSSAEPLNPPTSDLGRLAGTPHPTSQRKLNDRPLKRDRSC